MIMNKKGAVKNVRFFTAPFQGIGKKDAERTNRAKTRLQTCFCLPEGVQRYVEWRGLFVAQNTRISFFIKK